MPGLVPGIHVLLSVQGVDGRDKPGHDEAQRDYIPKVFRKHPTAALAASLRAAVFP